ncbi:TPA: hypothetical protein ACNVU4_002386 [Morganella morganii]|nr:hypothetical protein [Morganella morganii]
MSKSKAHHSDSNRHRHETAPVGQDGNRKSHGNNAHFYNNKPYYP